MRWQDNQYGHLAPMDAVSTICALDDTTAANGAIWVVDGSHLQGQRPADWTPLASEQERGIISEDVKGGAPCPMRAGQLLLLHAHTLHRSEGNRTDGHRRMLFCRYCDADAVEVYNDNAVRVGRLLAGSSIFPEVRSDGDDDR